MAKNGPLRVLIVDDSALMRKLLKDLLSDSDEVEVVGLARDGEQALEMAAELEPDVITLDVEMPGRSGIEILPELLANRPVPVLMVSSLTQEGAETTLAALSLGAVDYLPKPTHNQLAQMRAAQDLLLAKVKAAARCRVIRPRLSGTIPTLPPSSHSVARAPEPKPVPPPTPPPRRTTGSARGPHCVVVGISTGGPQALDQVLPFLRPPMPPIVIVQHMPGTFTGVFAKRLERACAVAVREATEGMRIAADQIIIAPGGRHLAIIGQASTAKISLSDDPPVSGHRPSVDVLFRSAAKVFGPQTLGLIMTGMGRDGVEGCKAILEAGGSTMGQDEATSVVYGMNKAAWVEGTLHRQFALAEFPEIIRSFPSAHRDRHEPG
ncbi:MAG: chemotaxis response regulator protein-glutamate methylesterase [Isosphaeraceae bacterium]|nr:chemotaxis response regulator protein-glutamate methylesterase [Isosphaeraceae bacterium]